MDPITIGLMLASVAGGLYSTSKSGKAADEALDWQKQRAAQQDRFAQAGRTDAYGNRISYDQALNEWITNLTPGQKALLLAGQSEQQRGLTIDAARNRSIRDRQYRAGTLAQPGLDEAIANLRFDRPEDEGSIRSKLTQLIAMSKIGQGGGKAAGYEAIRTGGNLPVVGRTPEGDSGISELAKTLLAARGGALSEVSARGNANASRYGDALSRFASLLGGGGAQFGMPDVAGPLANQQSDMAKILASVGAQGSQNVGGAQGNVVKAAGINPIDARALASIYSAGKKGTTGKVPANVGSATRFGDDPYSNDWIGGSSSAGSKLRWPGAWDDPLEEETYTSTSSVPGYGWY